MSKRIALLLLIMSSSVMVFAQDVVEGGAKKKVIEKPSRDFLMLQFTYEGWMKPDSINTAGLSRGFNGYLCYDFPIKKSPLSFAAGVGIGTSNIYFDGYQVVHSDSNARVEFIKETKDYKRYKLTTAYLEAPFEIRYFSNIHNRNRGFKAAVGLKVGTLVSAYTKGRINGTKTTEQLNRKDFYENWRFAGTLRLGWGNFSVFGSYNLTNLYKANQGPEIQPYSLGLCITGL